MITPELFGAVGDGRTNDTDAFAAMTAFVNRQSGGEIELKPTTYIVGKQGFVPNSGYAFHPADIMNFEGCAAPIILRGNGARLRCADGLRFGTFDPRTGLPTQHSLPYFGTGELSSPYFAMIKVANCTSQITIADLELDGNIEGHRIGGPWSSTGWQIGCTGLVLQDNLGPITIANVKSHHHAQDGGGGDGRGIPGLSERVIITDCEFLSNGRNAWSMTGGTGWTFVRCKFNKSGRNLPFPGSAPLAGIDFEAEGGKAVSEIRLVDCDAEDNAGVACVHPGTALVSDVCWIGGRIVGTTGWSYFGGNNEGIRFANVLFLGALVNLRKEVFERCTFSDDVAQTAARVLYNPDGFIIPDPVVTNRFTRCHVIHTTPILSRNGNWDQALFEDCTFRSAAGAGRLDVYGHFRGTETHFIAEHGGTDFEVTPGSRGGSIDAGGAEDPFRITTNRSITTEFPATVLARRELLPSAACTQRV